MAPKTERFEMRLETTMIERVDAWRRKQEDLPSRAEAFRRLIELGLSAKKTRAKVKT
jgi:metal-responsive CopG/Arc/MetJ family transcriptional regulator